MPSFPPPGSVTVCEINRDLTLMPFFIVTSEKFSDERAKETYGKILGVVFSPIPFRSDVYLHESKEGEEQENDDAVPMTGLSAMFTVVTNAFKRVSLQRTTRNGKWFAKVDIQVVCWHPHKHILAFISDHNQVSVHDYDDPEGQDPIILTSESLGDVTAIVWRPIGGRMLAVACKQGICIWSGSYPSNMIPVRSGVSSAVGTISRGSRSRWTLVDLLRYPDFDDQVVSLSWSPNGRLLASASSQNSSFLIWDVAQGVGTPIRRGLGNISMLQWSPLGDYFFTAKTDGSFYLWETSTWTSVRWSSTGGRVTGATWDPDGQMILMAFSDSVTLGSIHFSSKPPSLDGHLLPVELPKFSTNGSNGIERIAWDSLGDRLAVSYTGGDEKYDGLVAVYDVKRGPLVSASLVGFLRGPGEKARPLAFAFHNNVGVVDGAVLILSYLGHICFRSCGSPQSRYSCGAFLAYLHLTDGSMVLGDDQMVNLGTVNFTTFFHDI